MSENETVRQRIQQEFFKEAPDLEDEAISSLSLRSYLSRKVFETHQQPPDRLKKPELQPDMLPLPPEKPPETHQGYTLNNYDTELSAGIEQYLPTIATRLRVTKERLVKEIAAIETQLLRYQAVQKPCEDVKIKIKAMEARLQELHRHEETIDFQLIELFSTDSVAFQVSNTLEAWKQKSAELLKRLLKQISPESLIHRLDPQRYELVSLNRKLDQLNGVLEEQISVSKPAPAQISEVVNQYDHALHEVEVLADAIRHKISWRERWSEAINRFVRRLYT